MKTSLAVFALVVSLTGCGALGLQSLTSHYRSEGHLDRRLISGPVAFDTKDVGKAAELLGRGKKMFTAGSSIDAQLVTPAGRRLNYLKDAQRTRESREVIEAEFRKLDSVPLGDEICFVAGLTHSTLDLARASGWKLKVSVDDGEWITLKAVGEESVPTYTVFGGGNTEWYSSGVFCGGAKGWMDAQKNIRLNVFPPVFAVSSEAMLVWNLASGQP